MPALFTGNGSDEAVTPDDVRSLTGTTYSDFSLSDEEQYTELLQTWIDRICSQVYVRLRRQVDTSKGDYEGVVDVVVRTVAKVVAVGLQQRTSPVVQLSDFAITVLNTAEVTKDLDAELAPFIAYGNADDGDGGVTPPSTQLDLFSSLEEYNDAS